MSFKHKVNELIHAPNGDNGFDNKSGMKLKCRTVRLRFLRN